jgi:hypothetical protein
MPIVLADAVEIRSPRGGARRSVLACAALLVAALAPAFVGPAMAQEQAAATQSDEEPATTEDRLVLQRFTRCVAERQPAQARALIVADYRTDAYRDARRRLATSQRGCLPAGSRLRMGGILFAGGMAETLLAAAAPRGSLGARTALNPAIAPFHALDQGEVMNVCVVRAAPAEVEALLASEPGSAGEGAALRAVSPHIGPCLAAGTEMRLNRLGLRAMLALTAYRLVQHNDAPAVAAGN